MNNDSVTIISWVCVTIMFCVLISGITYYNVVKPTLIEVMERMVQDYNINPLIIECMDRDWSRVPEFEICKIVAENHKVKLEDIEKLQSLIRQD